jgi:hypothetical protein
MCPHSGELADGFDSTRGSDVLRGFNDNKRFASILVVQCELTRHSCALSL